MSVPRLIYLAQELRIPFPTSLERYLEFGHLINQIALTGVTGSSALGLADISQLMTQYEAGAKGGKATESEFRTLISAEIVARLEELHDEGEIELGLYLSTMQEARDFFLGTASIIPFEEGLFTDTDKAKAIPKFHTGFSAFDRITEGLYQGVTILMAPPGTGKTSHLATWASSMKLTDPKIHFHMYQTEIPQQMFLYRIKPLTAKTPFNDQDKIFYGVRPMSEVISRVLADPDRENLVVMYDSPDVLANSLERRFELEGIYKELVLMKGFCKTVIVPSQPKRVDTKNLKMESVSDAWQKAWYADIIIGFRRLGMVDGQVAQMQANVLKNRFGPPDLMVKYKYDLINLTAHDAGEVQVQGSDWQIDNNW